MADQTDLNGDFDDRTVDIEGFDRDAVHFKVSEMTRKIENLENCQLELLTQNEESEVKINELNHEIEALNSDKDEMKKVIERSEFDKKALESIAARAVELETEVSRLHHDFAEALNAGDEANAEVRELKKVIEELKRSEFDKEVKIQSLEKDKVHLSGRINKEVEEMKELRSKSENRIQYLTQNLVESEAKAKNSTELRIKIEREMKSEIEEKDGEIRRLKNLVEKLNLEKKAEERMKIEFKEALRKSEDMVKDRDLKGLKVDWASAAAAVASTGTIAAAAAAILYFNYGKRR